MINNVSWILKNVNDHTKDDFTLKSHTCVEYVYLCIVYVIHGNIYVCAQCFLVHVHAWTHTQRIWLFMCCSICVSVSMIRVQCSQIWFGFSHCFTVSLNSLFIFLFKKSIIILKKISDPKSSFTVPTCSGHFLIPVVVILLVCFGDIWTAGARLFTHVRKLV